MPVRWLYVLQSGSLVPGTASETPGKVAVAGASASNPIVGRVAFWTDDDTCKLNVNTAGDGGYFDTPRFGSVDEVPIFPLSPRRRRRILKSSWTSRLRCRLRRLASISGILVTLPRRD